MVDDRDIYDERLTFALPAALKQRLEEEAQRQGKRGSHLCRLAVETYLDSIQGTPSAAPAEEDKIKQLAGQVARRLGMDLGSFINLVLAEQLEGYIARAEQHEEKIRTLLERVGQKHGG